MSDFVGKQSRPQDASAPHGGVADRAVGKRSLVEVHAAVQRRAGGVTPDDPAAVDAAAARGVATPASPLPYGDAIQRSFGRHDISGVQAHVGGDAAASTRAMGADAYATGNHVVLGRGADLFTVAHEAAHVVQQRGGVQLKGGVGQPGDRYEQHADEVAQRVVAGQSAEDLLDRQAGPAAGGSAAGGAVQRRMGCEAEIAMPVTGANGRKMLGDFKLVNHEYFTLVTDSRTGVDGHGYSNLEFVMKPFDQLAGDADEANAELDRRLAAMKAVYDEIYSKTSATPITDLTGYGDTLTNPHDPAHAPADHAAAAGAQIDPTIAAYPKPDDRKLFVHYTVGFPIDKLYGAMGMVATQGYNVGGARPTVHAEGARTAADRVTAKFRARLEPADVDAVKGVIALLYAQVAAFAESVERQRTQPARDRYKKGQIKNKAALLSRVNLDEVFDQLPDTARGVLDRKTAREQVIDIIADVLEESADLDYGDKDSRQVGDLPAVTMAQYTASALGSGSVDQQQVFGGMNLTGVDHEGEGGAKIPVEMRNMYGQFRSWVDFAADARRLVTESRRLIDSPGASEHAEATGSGRKRGRP